jgi:hypothetical protein
MQHPSPLNQQVLPVGVPEWNNTMNPSDAPAPRSRHDIMREWMRAGEHARDGLLLEVLCDIRDLVGECAIRLSDLEAQSRFRNPM